MTRGSIRDAAQCSGSSVALPESEQARRSPSQQPLDAPWKQVEDRPEQD
jgi:hypothetical protein